MNTTQNNNIIFFDPPTFLEADASEEALFRIGMNHHWSKKAHTLIGQQLGAFLAQQDLFLQALEIPQ